MPLLASVPREAFAAVAALALLWALGVTAGRWHRAYRRRARFERAREGEREAGALLEALGFVVEAAQVLTRYHALVDGEAVAIELRADYLVTKAGKRFVAEVKTGRLAPRIETASTRRQLLEYRHAFDVDGVLLVDADARTVRVVELPAPHPARRTASPAVWLVVAALVVAVLFALR